MTHKQIRQRALREAIQTARALRADQIAAGYIPITSLPGAAGPAGSYGVVVAMYDGRRIASGVEQADGSIYWGPDCLVPPGTQLIPA